MASPEKVYSPGQAIRSNTHSMAIGYLLWIFGFTGAHRFYYGKPITGTIWFFTGGLLLVGALVDLVLIPGMVQVENLSRRLVQSAADARRLHNELAHRKRVTGRGQAACGTVRRRSRD